MGSGVMDLLVVPIQQYRRDGRVFRGLQKGTASFLSKVTTEAMDVTSRLVRQCC